MLKRRVAADSRLGNAGRHAAAQGISIRPTLRERRRFMGFVSWTDRNQLTPRGPAPAGDTAPPFPLVWPWMPQPLAEGWPLTSQGGRIKLPLYYCGPLDRDN